MKNLILLFLVFFFQISLTSADSSDKVKRIFVSETYNSLNLYDLTYDKRHLRSNKINLTELSKKCNH